MTLEETEDAKGVYRDIMEAIEFAFLSRLNVLKTHLENYEQALKRREYEIALEQVSLVASQSLESVVEMKSYQGMKAHTINFDKTEESP